LLNGTKIFQGCSKSHKSLWIYEKETHAKKSVKLTQEQKYSLILMSASK